MKIYSHIIRSSQWLNVKQWCCFWSTLIVWFIFCLCRCRY